jgi:serine/threonine-protein kinase
MSSREASGRITNHYEIETLLGSGASGRVYKARDTRLKREVALKFLAPQLAASPEARERFLREAHAVSALNHPHIAVIHDISEEGEEPYLVFEFLPGGTLQQHAAGRKLTLPELVSYGAQIAAALEHAHRRGIVHRDLKPHNMLFAAPGHLKLIDFGVAKYITGEEPTEDGRVRGTISYFAPEQARGEPVDGRADLFALGVVLYQLATGRRPFEAEHPAAVLDKILHAEPEPVAASRPDLPAAFGAIVTQCLKKRPAERYQSAAEVEHDLRALAGDSQDSERTRTVALPRPLPRVRLRRLAMLPALLLLALLVLAPDALFDLRRKWAGARLPPQRHLAVLPLEPVGGDAADAAFAVGLTETLVGLLSQTEQFQRSFWVVPTSELRRAEVKSAREAHRAFRVNLVLAGSLQRSGDEVRVVLSLSEAATPRLLNSKIVTLRRAETARLPQALMSAALDLLAITLPVAASGLTVWAAPRTADAASLCLEARGHLRGQTAAGNDRAADLLEEALRIEPEYAPAQALLSVVQQRRFLLTREEKWLELAEGLAVRAAAAVQTPDTLRALGAIERLHGRTSEAIAAYRRALELDPSDEEARRALGLAYEQAGLWQEAEQALIDATRRRTGYWPALASLGGFYVQRGEYRQALEPLRAAIRLAPENPLNAQNLGGLYAYMDRYNDAAPLLERAIALGGGAVARGNLAVVRFYNGEYAEAARLLKEAVAAEPADAIAWGDYAQVCEVVAACRGESRPAYEKAVQLAEAALRLNPSEPSLRASLALYQAKLGLAEESRANAARAIEEAPGAPGIIYKSARAAEAAGDRRRALDLLRQALGAGYSRVQVENEPDLRRLREDPGYAALRRAARTR